MARCAGPLRSTQKLKVSGACTTHAALPISCGWQPTRHHRVPALCEASAHAVQLNAARGPSWRARVRPAEALGRACQRDSRSEGPGAAPAPEDRPYHPCFAARKLFRRLSLSCRRVNVHVHVHVACIHLLCRSAAQRPSLAPARPLFLTCACTCTYAHDMSMNNVACTHAHVVRILAFVAVIAGR